MKKLLFTFLMLLTTCVVIIAQGTKTQTSQQKDVRNLSWGCNLATVLKTEDKLDSLSYVDNTLTLTGIVLGKSSIVEYQFDNNGKLFSVTIWYYHTDFTGNDAIEEFNRIRYILQDKYGEPKFTDEDWSNETYKERPDKLGLALKLEHVKLGTFWGNNRSSILEYMESKNDNVLIYISYVSKEHLNQKKSKERNEI